MAHAHTHYIQFCQLQLSTLFRECIGVKKEQKIHFNFLIYKGILAIEFSHTLEAP